MGDVINFNDFMGCARDNRGAVGKYFGLDSYNLGHISMMHPSVQPSFGPHQCGQFDELPC